MHVDLDTFKRLFDAAEKPHTKLREKWRRMDAVYHGTTELPSSSRELLRSRLQVPWAYAQVETIIPRVMDPEPVFAFHPVEPSDEALSKVLNALVKWQLAQDRFVVKQRHWVEDAMVRGLAVAKVIWVRREQTMLCRSKPTPMDVLLRRSPAPREKRVLVANRPSIVYVEPEDFFWDPTARSLEEARYVFHRSWLSAEELKQRAKDGVYENVSEALAQDSDAMQRSAMESMDEADARRGDRYPVLEGWFPYDNTVMTVCGDAVLRQGANPYYHGAHPFVAFATQPNSRSLVGVSEVEKIEHLQLATWTTDNQRIDAVTMALNLVTIIDPTIRGWQNLQIRPGAKIPASQGQRVEQLQLNPNTAPAYEQTEAYLGAMQQVTGASPFLSGSDPSQYGIENDTATGASISQEEANKRMAIKKLQFRLFEAQIAKLMVQLNHQYLTDMEIKRIVGEAGLDMPEVSAEEIPMFLDVLPQGMTDSMSKSTERNALAEASLALQGMHLAPMGDGTVFTMKPLIDKQLASYDLPSEAHYVPESQAMPMQAPGGGGVAPMNEPTIQDETAMSMGDVLV